LAYGAPVAEGTGMRLVILAAVSGLSGCSLFMHSIEKPKASVRDVSLTSAGMVGVSGQVQLDVMNPNNFGVPLSGIDWQLSLGSARLATGTVQLNQTIPARGTAPITTTLGIATSDALAIAGALASGTRDYHLTAQLHFSTAVGQVDVDVEHAGHVGG
jgi:LEA14-like dessication related protein